MMAMDIVDAGITQVGYIRKVARLQAMSDEARLGRSHAAALALEFLEA